jgi:glutathione S-transferase
MATPFTLHGDRRSGNCLKIKFVADHLSLPYIWREVDVLGGETRTPAFLKINPAGQVPVVTWQDGRSLAQSNAIIRYLARDSALLPEDPFTQAQVDSWLFWEQYSHEPYVAVARFQMAYLGKPRSDIDPKLVERGNAALDLMEFALGFSEWLVGKSLTIADVALLAYTRLAPEGGFSVASRPRVSAWISACEDALNIPPISGTARHD